MEAAWAGFKSPHPAAASPLAHEALLTGDGPDRSPELVAIAARPEPHHPHRPRRPCHTRMVGHTCQPSRSALGPWRTGTTEAERVINGHQRRGEPAGQQVSPAQHG